MSVNAKPSAATFRSMLSKGVVIAPGVWDGLSARAAEQAGFDALCASGYAIAASLGLPDAEIYSMTENLEAVRRIRGASQLPIVADIDTGYGNAVNAARTASLFAAAGVQAVFMEDQESPKRCPLCITDPPDLIPIGEAVGKIRAVKDAVGDALFLIGRTDAHGDDAVRRAEAYANAGAEMIMPTSKGLPTVEDWARLQKAAGVPLMAAMASGTWVEREMDAAVLEELNVRLALLPTQPLLAVTDALVTSLERLMTAAVPAEVSKDYMSNAAFAEFIGFADVTAAQEKYLPAKGA